MFWVVVAVTAVMAVAWLVRINMAMRSVPEGVREASPRRWTKQELRDTYERVKQKPLDFVKLLPPRLDRRYVVVGGSGKPLVLSCPVNVRHCKTWDSC
jgi:hypothetical protein